MILARHTWKLCPERFICKLPVSGGMLGSIVATVSVHVANERIKSIAGLLTNSGGALLAAAIVRFYGNLEIDLPLAIWSIGAGMLIWFGWLALSLLESEMP